MTELDPHLIAPGKIGVVSHQLLPDVLFVWGSTRFRTNLTSMVIERASEGLENLYTLKYFIPHGTPLFIFRGPLKLAIIKQVRTASFYKILWNDEFCLVETQWIINPYMHGGEPK